MPNSPTPEMMSAKPKSSPNVVEWFLVALVILTLVGLGALFTLIQQLNQSVSSTNAEVMEIKQGLMEQKNAMMEEADAAMKEDAKMVQDTGPLTFGELGPDIVFSFQHVASPFDVEDLTARALDCGQTRSVEELTALAQFFEGEGGVEYFFRYLPPAQVPSYRLVVLPNLPGYKTMEEFEAYFQGCSAGWPLYPIRVTDKNLVFASSCGSGYSDDSGRPSGCVEMREIIEPTFQVE